MAVLDETEEIIEIREEIIEEIDIASEPDLNEARPYEPRRRPVDLATRTIREMSTGNATAYGGAYNSGVIDLAMAEAPSHNLVPLNTASPGVRISSANNGVKIEENGLYEIRYFANFSFSDSTYIEWHIAANNQNLDATGTSLNMLANEMKTFERTTVARLNAGTVLQVYASPEVSGTLYVRPNGLSILVKRIVD